MIAEWCRSYVHITDEYAQSRKTYILLYLVMTLRARYEQSATENKRECDKVRYQVSSTIDTEFLINQDVVQTTLLYDEVRYCKQIDVLVTSKQLTAIRILLAHAAPACIALGRTCALSCSRRGGLGCVVNLAAPLESRRMRRRGCFLVNVDARICRHAMYWRGGCCTRKHSGQTRRLCNF